MSFRFRLDTLLRLRMAERDQRRADLAKALRAEEMLGGERSRLEDEQHQIAERTRLLKAPGEANVDALLHAHRYERVLVAQHQQLASQLAQIEAEVQRRRQVLVEADRQVRVLEKLRERQAAAHRANEAKLETKQLDEAGLVAYLRRQEVPR
jgi:flagellar protein FliJ